ncbi:uncharacterized protein LOC123292237 [Chrysoperla carnea]|uniref:uncharacterized protein LOC123292237 n=1 Tax=Chrysoperla carnea TaxID=189513 RepID=UPI001D094B2D|nr:uncharacterized protein LOC123292237 [Chrysoperla carnea]
MAFFIGALCTLAISAIASAGIVPGYGLGYGAAGLGYGAAGLGYGAAGIGYAGAGLGYAGAAGHGVDYYSYPKYSFNYGVKDAHTGDVKSQSEVRDGDVVKGQYSLVEPDGSVRVVDYTADDHNGFNAVVKKVGPTVHYAPAPVAHGYVAGLGHGLAGGYGAYGGYGHFAKFLGVLLFVSFTYAGYVKHEPIDYYSHPKYAFKYGVADHITGDVKSQHEERDGGVVKGSYSLVEPDGSVRTVNYVADPVNGFNAVVSKSAPTVHVKPAPVVVKPAPVFVKPIVVAEKPIIKAYEPHHQPIYSISKAAVHALPNYVDYDSGYYGDTHGYYGDSGYGSHYNYY